MLMQAKFFYFGISILLLLIEAKNIVNLCRLKLDKAK